MIYFRDAAVSDLGAVASLHENCFKGTFIASLGKHLIAKYYGEFLNEGGPFVLALDDDKPVGLCMGYFKGSKARDMFIKKNKFALALRVFPLCALFKKAAWQKAWNYLFGRKVSPMVDSAFGMDADLLSICVLPEYRGYGVSEALMKEFEKRVIAEGKHDLMLSVYKTNERAISFYKKMGYDIAGEKGTEYKMYKHLG